MPKYRKGVSGNPSGRPKGALNKHTQLAQLMEEHAEALISKTIELGLFPKTRQYTTEPNRLATKGNILLSVRAPVGDINIASTDCCIGRGLAALNSKYGYDSYLFYVLKYFKSLFDLKNSEGTTFGSITKDGLFGLNVIYPEENILSKYNKIVSKYNKLIFKNGLENLELEKLRDWLLPMLMNGQVTLK